MQAQWWCNCGNERCGILTGPEIGYEELAWVQIEPINTVPRVTVDSANTNLGKGGTWKVIDGEFKWLL